MTRTSSRVNLLGKVAVWIAGLLLGMMLLPSCTFVSMYLTGMIRTKLLLQTSDVSFWLLLTYPTLNAAAAVPATLKFNVGRIPKESLIIGTLFASVSLTLLLLFAHFFSASG